jgi:hypothetical protein
MIEQLFADVFLAIDSIDKSFEDVDDEKQVFQVN